MNYRKWRSSVSKASNEIKFRGTTQRHNRSKTARGRIKHELAVGARGEDGWTAGFNGGTGGIGIFPTASENKRTCIFAPWQTSPS